MQRRLVIVEGIMGSGKSTAARSLAACLNDSGRPARPLTEKKFPHPLRATDELEHWFQPWLDVSVDELASRNLAKWQAFVAASIESGTVVTTLDGQLFHGDVTHLFLMEAGDAFIRGHLAAVARAVRPVSPLVVYLYQADVGRAIRTVGAQRGEEWLQSQLDWKLAFPYARRRNLSGLEGLVALYQDYRRLTDHLFTALDADKLAIETSAGDWPAYEDAMRRALGVADSPAPDRATAS
ncbi:MAG: hypothetical protein Q8R01_12040 [Ramlibacter sp.]|nr:hypothetical protein [Ramlibacter sp.]